MNHHPAIGLRLSPAQEADFKKIYPRPVDFVELEASAWVYSTVQARNILDDYAIRYPLRCYGNVLTLGEHPLSRTQIATLKLIMDDYGIVHYTEDLPGQDDLLAAMSPHRPCAFTQAVFQNLSRQIDQVQTILQRSIGIKNVAYYAAEPAEWAEAEFFQNLVRQTGCHWVFDAAAWQTHHQALPAHLAVSGFHIELQATPTSLQCCAHNPSAPLIFASHDPYSPVQEALDKLQATLAHALHPLSCTV